MNTIQVWNTQLKKHKMRPRVPSNELWLLQHSVWTWHSHIAIRVYSNAPTWKGCSQTESSTRIPTGPSAMYSSSKKTQTVGEIFQEFLAFSILSWKIGNSKAQLVLLNLSIIIPRDLQLTISDKKAFSYTFNRVKSHIHTVLVELILRQHMPTLQLHIECWKPGSNFPHFQRCRTVSAPAEMPRILEGKKTTFLRWQIQRQQTRFPKILLRESSQLPRLSCTEFQPSFSRV